eukprot:GHVO01057873.1.p1 GENE.GHVO01057873.1~~GHVO01057873.1.p1  ORF type:complete len:225 (+),score=20.17 GHVO01057873.1:956-1630(+)
MPEHLGVSAPCYDFLRIILSKMPEDRTTAEELKNHPWLDNVERDRAKKHAVELITQLCDGSEYDDYENPDDEKKFKNQWAKPWMAMKEMNSLVSMPLEERVKQEQMELLYERELFADQRQQYIEQQRCIHEHEEQEGKIMKRFLYQAEKVLQNHSFVNRTNQHCRYTFQCKYIRRLHPEEEGSETSGPEVPHFLPHSEDESDGSECPNTDRDGGSSDCGRSPLS